MKVLLQYLKPHTAIMLWTMAFKFFAAMMDLIIPSLLARIIDRAVPSRDPGQIYFWGGMMIVCAALSITTNVYANRTAARTSGKVTLKLRHDLFSKFSRLPLARFEEISLSSAVSRLTSDTYNINQFLNRTQRMGVRAPILLIGGLIMTLSLDLRLTLVLVFALPFIFLIVYGITSKTVPLYTKQQGILDQLVRVTQENISGIRIIKALSKTEYEQRRFDGVNAHLADTFQQAGRISALSNPLTSLTLNLGLTAVVLAGGYLVSNSLSTAGAIIAFLNYFTLISMAMMGITRIFIMLSRGIASARRVAEVLSIPEDAPLPGLGEANAGAPHVLFRDVSFGYSGKGYALRHISFSLMQGETLGIIGATGSGKTTLIKLLLRLYEANEGSILIRGRDILSIPADELREGIGVVFQNDFIMAESLRENIRYYRDIPDERLWQAAEDAQAAEFIKSFKEGLDYRAAQKGNNLSGGQKQRILIARALAGQPELLILDDSSSALDYRTDAALRKALAKNYNLTTKLVIAQRVSSIMNANQILVLDEGRAIGCGSHQELMNSCPAYREIAELQMGARGGMTDEQ